MPSTDLATALDRLKDAIPAIHAAQELHYPDERGMCRCAVCNKLRLLGNAVPGEHDSNTPIRMWIALQMVRAWNHGPAGFSADVLITVNQWIDGGMVGPIPWPNSPFFSDWAVRNGFSNCDGNVGFRFQVELVAADHAYQIGGHVEAPGWHEDIGGWRARASRSDGRAYDL